MFDKLQKFVDDEVIRIVKTSTTYKHIRKSKEDNFSDITYKQWDSCTASVLCYLKNKYRKQFVFTQADLLKIAKFAAIKLMQK